MDYRSYNRPRGSSMKPTNRRCLGYSLVEVLTVLVIVGILAGVGVYMVGNNRTSGGVRNILDEMEGVLASAQQRTVATGRDVVLTSLGNWDPVTPLTLTYTGASDSESFNLAVNAVGGGLAREHKYAGVVTAGNAGWWATATTVAGYQAIADVEPFKDVSGFSTTLTTPNNFFRGGAVAGTARISGSNKRFTTSFYIEVVSISSGLPLPGGPAGLLVVLANGSTIYKFYNPGVLNGSDGQWRRI